MSINEDELNKILTKSKPNHIGGKKYFSHKNEDVMPASTEAVEEKTLSNLVQWTTGDNKAFFPASKTVKQLIPGAYEIKMCHNAGLFFEKLSIKTEGLLRFPQTNSDKVVQEIQNFWNREKMFKDYQLTYKRGIILWGPPGGGKTSVIQIIMKDVIDRGGIVIKFQHPGLFIDGMRKLREIEKETPVVVLMEDIDSILEIYNGSEVLNVLDGVDDIQKMVFLATTNYPDRLGARIINRPSRFDKRFKIDHPNSESRRIYFKHLIGNAAKIDDLNVDLDKWVKDTKGFSIAHLKELFVAVVILGDDYNESVETLRNMKEDITPRDYEDRYNKPVGFLGSACSDEGED